jgi:hypothetical protein
MPNSFGVSALVSIGHRRRLRLPFRPPPSTTKAARSSERPASGATLSMARWCR